MVAQAQVAVTPGQVVKSAKTYVGYASEGAKKLAEMSAAAQKLEKAGETLGEIDAVLAKMAFVAKISVALQVVSVGLAVVQVFLPVKSEEDLILDAVKEVSAKVTQLSATMKTEFQRLTNVVWTATAQANLENHLGNVATVAGYLESIAAKRKLGQDTSYDEGQLAAYDLGKVKDAVVEIERYVTGTVTAPNLLQLIYEHSYGDVKTVALMASYLSYQAQLAVSAHAGAQALRDRTAATAAGKAWTDADAMKLAEDVAGDASIPTDYAAQLQNIAGHCHAWAARCTNPHDRHDNIERYTSDMAYLFVPAAKDLQGTADRHFGGLSAKWPWLNFTVLAYEAVAGFDKHCLTYSGPAYRTIFLKGLKDVGGDKLNMILYFAPRTKATSPATMRLAEADANASAPRRFAVDAISTLLNMPKPYLFNPGLPRPVSDLRPILANFGPFAHPSSLNDWHGDFVWAGWNNANQYIHDGNPDVFMGLASANPAILKRSVYKLPGGNRGGLIHDEVYLGYVVLAVADDAH